MAYNSANVAKTARLLAIAHIINGVLLLCFGIADLQLLYYVEWTGVHGFGIWIGIWMCITGALGIPGSERTGFRNVFADVFMGFSITSAVFGLVIIICYSIGISQLNDALYDHFNDPFNTYSYGGYKAELTISSVILILGIVAFVIGIWAALCCCLLKSSTLTYILLKPSTCCTQKQCHATSFPGFFPYGQQVMCTANPASCNIMNQLSDGVPVAVPVETDDGMVAAQGVKPTFFPVSVSGESVGQSASSVAMATGSPPRQVKPQFVEIGPPDAISIKSFPPQHPEMPHSHGQGGYMQLQKEQN